MHRLYAYANSSDLSDLEDSLVAAFGSFAQRWQVAGVLLTNRRLSQGSNDELPDWNIGIRVNTEELERDRVDELLSFLLELNRNLGMPFVVGTWRHRQIGTKDLCVVDRQIPDGAAAAILEGTLEGPQ